MMRVQPSRIGERLAEISTGDAGALGEILVAADLISRGIPVFRAMSPSAPCDLIVLWADRAVRVEVRTGQESFQDSDLLTVPLHPDRDAGRFDVLAVVIARSRDIRQASPRLAYFPDLFGTGHGLRLGPSPAAKLAAWGLIEAS